MILEAQKHTKSNMAAAKWMGINYSTYKKYAKMYGVFEQHLNQKGLGVKKGFAMRTVNVEDIVLGKREPPQRWSQSVVKEELIDKGYWQDECSVCGYNEVSLETNKVCLGIDFGDGNSKNWLLDNIRLLCVNCYYSFNAQFPGSKKFCK
jgi:DNA-binding transcriptional regulator YdaS (Cro superfamily)